MPRRSRSSARTRPMRPPTSRPGLSPDSRANKAIATAHGSTPGWRCGSPPSPGARSARSNPASGVRRTDARDRRRADVAEDVIGASSSRDFRSPTGRFHHCFLGPWSGNSLRHVQSCFGRAHQVRASMAPVFKVHRRATYLAMRQRIVERCAISRPRPTSCTLAAMPRLYLSRVKYAPAGSAS